MVRQRPLTALIAVVAASALLGPARAQDLGVTLLVQEGDALSDRPDEFLIVAPQRDELAISANGQALVSGDDRRRPGEVGRVFAEDCTFDRGAKIGVSGNFNSRVELRDCDVSAGSLKITANDFAGSIDLNGGTYDGKCSVKVASAPESLPTVQFTNVIVGGALSVSGRGSLTLGLSGGASLDGGVRFSAKGPGLHSVSVNGITAEGTLSISSKKGRLQCTLNEMANFDRALIKTKGPGNDFVSIENTMLGALLKVSTHLGDDDVSVQGTSVPKASFDGGKNGDDRLDLGGTSDNTIGTDSFKEFEGFEIRPLD